jgi:rhamnosyltransferase subunit B
MGKRIIIATNGTLGDLYPYVAIGLALKQRGHTIGFASNQIHRDWIEAKGLEFFSLRPSMDAFGESSEEIMRQLMHPKTGGEYLFRQLLLPYLKETYEDLMLALQNADLLFSHSLMLAAPLVAEQTNIPWVSSVLGPICFASIYDPSVTSLSTPRFLLHPQVMRCLLQLIRYQTETWMQPLRGLRADLGLPPGKNPVLEGQHSPRRVIALFSEVFAKPQKDWPPQAQTTGFMFSDQLNPTELAPEISDFLADGDAPIVFTLGSSAIFNPGDFFRVSLAAVQRLGCRAILIVGDHASSLPDNFDHHAIMVCQYVSFAQLFPHAAAVVHQGGIGTTAEAFRAGTPMLIVPHAHDQPDNAIRAQHLGVARIVARSQYTAKRVSQELQYLLSDDRYRISARQISSQICLENGLETACELIENSFC